MRYQLPTRRVRSSPQTLIGVSRKTLRCLVLFVVSLALVSCGPKANGPVAKPTPPLELAEPAALPDRLAETDLKNMDADELFMLGRSAANQKSYHVAAIAQYWHVKKSQSGHYDLACYLARIGKFDSAFYWLQIAAIEDGVDTDHAQQDEDLESLRKDPRWKQVLQYMQNCNKYFESAPVARTVLILPTGYQSQTPIPAVLWLHGFGSNPEGFVNDGAQEYADQLNVALIGVSGTKARGPRSFVWSDDVEQNAKRLRDAIAEVSDRVTIKQGDVVTLGFSQGAQAGLEVAVRYPKEYAGSIVLSPGAEPQLKGVKPSRFLEHRGFVLSCGADEHPGNVQLTEMDADWLRRAKAFVIHKAYPGVSAHSFPADFDDRFVEWVTFVLKARTR